MTIVVLLSAGRHPVSGAAVLPRVEAQAIRLAAGLGQAIGLHAGPDPAAVAEALGLGLSRIIHIVVPGEADPVRALAARLASLEPDLILAGRRGQGGQETGMVPYAIADALACALIPDVIALAAGPSGDLVLDQNLNRGARRQITLRGPVLATIHADAPAPLSYAYGQARRGRIETIEGLPSSPARAVPALEERPYRRRPKIVKGAPSSGSAAERLKAATGESGASGGGRLLVDPEPEEAAREILAHLRRIGVLAPTASDHR